jgi:hypothetical protein
VLKCELDASGSGQGPVGEHGNEPLDSIKGGEISRLAELLLASQEGLCSMV